MQALCADLAAEHAALDAVLEATVDWDAPTPADGWTIRDTVSHLWFFDQRALLALTDPEAFADGVAVLLERGVDASVEPGRAISPAELHAAWRRDRRALVEHATTVDPSTRVPWYGPAMGARSFITARIMETWAHGQDIVDVVGADREPTARLRHVAHIGVRARPYSYAVNGLELPDADVYVALDGPGGDRWEWGDPSAPDRVTGSALDFCLVVTQRRHLADAALSIEGDLAAEWMAIAQAFAGSPGNGRAPLRGD
ncbi:MAG: TIGR03084 family metal-binding protein [Ilumatobacteraceae bacterium]